MKIGFSHEDKKMCHGVRKWGAEGAWEERGNRRVERTSYCKGPRFVLLTRYYYSGDQTMNIKMGETCDPCGGKRRYAWFCWENMKKQEYLEDIEIDRWIILKCIYLSTRISSQNRWSRLLLPWRNLFIKLVVKKNKTQFTFKTHFRKPYSLWVTEYKVLHVYIFKTVCSYWPICNVIRNWTILQVKNIKLLIDFRLCWSLMFTIQKYLIAHWHYIFYDFQVENCITTVYIFLSIENP